MIADVLSDVLRAVRLTGAVYFDFNLTAPWVAEAPPSHEIAGIVMPGAERVIEYHLVVAGAAWGHAIGATPIRLREGDLLVLPQGDAHVLSSAPGMRAAPTLAIYARTSTPLPLVYELGAGGTDRTRIICGFLGCDERPFNPLLTALPSVIHLSAGDADAGHEAARHVARFRRARVWRRGNPGTRECAGAAVRADLRRGDPPVSADAAAGSSCGWLAGLRDPIVGRALEALHGAPRDPWTVESLGRTVGVSRSVLAARFTEMVGHPPMHYLTLWRMQLAARLLHDGHHVVAVAAAIGYESESAFSRTFKKLMGVPPATWRRGAGPR